MANTITAFDTIPGRVMGLGPIYMIKAVYDGTAGLEDIKTVSGTDRVFVLDVQVVEGGGALTVTLGSNATAVVPYEFATGEGIVGKVENGFVFATKAGEKFVASASAACTVLFYCVVGNNPDLGAH